MAEYPMTVHVVSKGPHDVHVFDRNGKEILKDCICSAHVVLDASNPIGQLTLVIEGVTFDVKADLREPTVIKLGDPLPEPEPA